jgi:large subunit ribosomal protein L25
MIQHQATDIEVQCLPADIPSFIEVDMLKVETGEIIHLSDIVLPAGVTSVALALGEDHDLAVASVIAPKGGDEGLDVDASAAAKDSGSGEGNSED